MATIKRADRYEKARKQFLKDNPPDHAGYHYCHYGGGAVTHPETDHKDGRKGDLIDDPDNFVKSCHFHNTLKGSMKYGQFMKKLEKNPSLRVCP